MNVKVEDSRRGVERASVTHVAPRSHWIAIAGACAVGCTLLTTGLQFSNTRTLVSWHGFVHTAIANRFPGRFAVPENPFFAGEPLPYYWFYHYAAGLVSAALTIDTIHAFQLITAAGLIVLWLSAGALGAYRLGSVRAGLVVAFLALAGVNPLGPAVAAAKSIGQRVALFSAAPPAAAVETVFVSNEQANDLITQPLLSALYVGADWRRGQNVVWYLDNSSRGIALALAMPLLFVFTGTFGWKSALSMSAIGAGMTAFNPIIGLGAVGSLLGGSVLVWVTTRTRSGGCPNVLAPLGLAAAAALGAAAVGPTYYHLFMVGRSDVHVLGVDKIVARSIALAVNLVVLLPMAFWAARRAPDRLRDHCRILVIAACALLIVIPFVALPEDNEHNFANVAQCLLALPAVALTATKRWRSRSDLLLAGLFVPMTVATLVSYLGRPSLPIGFDGRLVHRTSSDPLETLYQWARVSTSRDAVFVCDPSRPVKMSGNVAELPAFTGRTLFVDQASYLTSPHGDFPRRQVIATRMTEGVRLSDADAAYVAALHRPIFLLSYRGTDVELMHRLTQLYGLPVLHEGLFSVFHIRG